MTLPYEQTDDPNDPCAYCVHWEEPEDSANFEEAIPYCRPGVPATRLYRHTHDECEKAVALYIAESAAL